MSFSKNVSRGWIEATNNAKSNKPREFVDSNIYIKEYQGLFQGERFLKAADIASDNGRCWWIREFVKYKPY